VLSYLSDEKSGSTPPLPYESLLAAVPNHEKELGLPPFDATEFASKVWSKDSLVELLQEAIKLLDEAQLYEEAIVLFQLMLAVYQQDANYSDMVPALTDFRTMTEALVAANSNQARLPPNFYRVGLYGSAFGAELNGKEFIYKVSPSLTLGHFQKKLVAQFGKTIGTNNIEVLTTNKDIDIPALDPSKAHIQIGKLARNNTVQYFRLTNKIDAHTHARTKATSNRTSSRRKTRRIRWQWQRPPHRTKKSVTFRVSCSKRRTRPAARHCRRTTLASSRSARSYSLHNSRFPTSRRACPSFIARKSFSLHPIMPLK
jgi:hypothetical protein